MPRTGGVRVWLAAGTLLAGCNDFQVGDSNGPSGEAPLTVTEAAELVSEVRDELGALARGYSVDGQLSPRVQLPVETAGLISSGTSFSRPRSCARLSESHWRDSDEDKVPDDLTVSYDSTRCTFTSSGGGAVFTLRGQVHITDPSSTVETIRLKFNGFEQRLRLNQAQSWLRRINGVALLTAQAGGMVGSDSALILRQSSGHGPATLLKVWNLSFVSGERFSPKQALPNGVLTISGSLARTVANEERRLLVATPSPLVLDASCGAGDHLTSGTLELNFDRPGGGTAVRVTWNGCGTEPSVTVNPASPGS